ncbi:hypothetical protein C3747_18g368 [Trypanosoma cruzi]|uniref:Uncharacterized protein n=2 Tax=Trypanosoma cruzi TaxID=5693 RepID=Q4D7R8_TRYCC|nr:hypothetical protein, conserved [Trypanosoma cruzi]EAN88573.1 hypothetical protein, conserved [Trypanosoma cruzi]PWV17352.1 hypothetical protein C3747_18g368 [Trypanosoma cruzi]|eukprot:XP_810424.1 hypothetical protein [Trypanosoma cruzi strain CL Brener]
MFRCFFWLSSKPTATRRRASQTAMRTAVHSTRETNRREAHADGGNALLASMYPAFKTKDLAQLLEKPLPSTANVLTIDGTAGVANSSASSILRFVITHDEEVSKLQNNPEHPHPLLLLVQTSLDKDDADTNEFVLTSALQQRDRLKDATAIVLDAAQSAAAKSVLKLVEGNKLEERREGEPADATGGGDADAPLKKDPQEDVTVENHEGEAEQQPPEAEDVLKSSNTKKTSTVAKNTASTTTKTETKTSTSSNKGKKNANVSKKTNKDGSLKLSYTPPPGAVKPRSTSVPPTRDDMRESLQKMFCSSLAAPFQPPKQVERALFAGYVDRVRVADMMNLPIYGGGEVYTLYYRLTGAGACRTPLITITHILEGECRKKKGKEANVVDVITKNRVPILLLLGAPFLIAEDAQLICEEYQKALQESFSSKADVTVLTVPNCFTERNVLFALRSASIDDGADATKGHQQYKKERGKWSELLTPSSVRHCGQDAVQRPSESLSENVLRSVVSNALEEVALRHEKSTDHLVSTLNKLVEYWSRERVIELMEGLQGEREVLVDATKEFGNVQQQLRNTRSAMEALQRDMKSVNDKIERFQRGAGGVPSGDTSAILESTRALEARLAESLCALPSKQQISLDLREELEDVQRNLQRHLDQTLSKKLKTMHEDQQHDLQQLLKESSGGNGNDQLTQIILQELPQRIQTAMERALSSFSQNSDERTRSLLESQQKAAQRQISALCDRLCDTVEAGQGRVVRTVSELLSTKLDGHGTNNADDKKLHAADNDNTI